MPPLSVLGVSWRLTRQPLPVTATACHPAEAPATAAQGQESGVGVNQACFRQQRGRRFADRGCGSVEGTREARCVKNWLPWLFSSRADHAGCRRRRDRAVKPSRVRAPQPSRMADEGAGAVETAGPPANPVAKAPFEKSAEELVTNT